MCKETPENVRRKKNKKTNTTLSRGSEIHQTLNRNGEELNKIKATKAGDTKGKYRFNDGTQQKDCTGCSVEPPTSTALVWYGPAVLILPEMVRCATRIVEQVVVSGTRGRLFHECQRQAED